MKIVHCADIHLDSPFSGLDSSQAAIKREDIRRSFSKIIALVKDENADALIIAGDLFDGKNVSKLTLDFIVSKFSEIADVPVFIAAGNHDPKDDKSYYNIINWGKNVHIFDTKPEIVRLGEMNVLGVSFESSKTEVTLISEENLNKSELPQIIVMHANLSGTDYNPISKEFVTKSGVVYFASGHIHKNLCEKIGDTLFCYPGCPEGRGFDELGEKGAYIVEIDGNSAKARFVPLCQREYCEVEINVSDVNSYEGIIGKIMLNGNIDPKNLYKIILFGECDFVIDTAVICDAISAFYVKVVDNTTQKIDLLAISEDFSVKGLFVKKMLEKMKEEGETEELRRALSFGLAAIRGEKVNP